jgi:hypothetical protein
MGDGDVAGLVRMLVLPVVALATNTLPTLGLEPSDDIDATHVVYAYTTFPGRSRGMHDWPDGFAVRAVKWSGHRDSCEPGLERECQPIKETEEIFFSTGF